MAAPGVAMLRVTLLALLMGCGGPTATTAPAPASVTVPLGWVEWSRHDGAPDAALPMVVVLHGLGDRPENLIGLFGDWPDGLRVVAPRAPVRWGNGFAWMDPPGQDRVPGTRDEEMNARVDELAHLIDALTAARPTVGKPVVTGFSQGGILSFALAVRHPDRISAAVPIAGALPADWVPSTASAGQAAVPIRAMHGDADTVLPLAPTQAVVDRLAQAGFDARLQVFPGVEHRIPGPVREAVHAAVRAELSSP